LGVTGISTKIREVIAKVQAPIGKAIDWLIGKAYNLVKSAGKLLGFGKGEDNKNKEKKEQPELDLKVEKSLSMDGEGHTIYAKVQGGKLTIEMASGRLEEIQGALATAIPVAKKNGKDKLAKDLDLTYAGMKSIEEDLNAVPYLPKEERGQAESKLLRAISSMAASLERTGNKHGIQSLIDLGHPSQYVKDKKIKLEYRESSLFRSLFYGRWNSVAETHRTTELANLKLEAKDPKWSKDPNFGNPKAFVCKDKNNNWTPYLALDKPRNVVLDHILEVSRYWNQQGHNEIQSTREIWYNKISNLQVIDEPSNSKKGGVDIDHTVGEKFRGSGE
jgi:hypothetical protein